MQLAVASPTSSPVPRSKAREYFTVDLSGLRAALAARAAASGVTESDVLRSALAASLGADAAKGNLLASPDGRCGRTRSDVKLSVRLTHRAAQRLDQNSRTAGLSRGAYLTRLIDAAPPLLASTDRKALASALNHSAEEIAGFGRDIRTHLDLAGRVLAEMRTELGGRSGRLANVRRAPGSP